LSAIKKIRIPIPTMEEQMEFVRFVEQSDKSKFELKQAIEDVNNMMKVFMEQNIGKE
jgi:restriction endonuclease S subunit